MVQNKSGILYQKAMKGSSHTTSLHLRSLDTVSGEGDVDELLFVTFCFWTQELIQSLKRWVLQSNAIMLKNPNDPVGNQSHEALLALQDREFSKDSLFFDPIPFPRELLYHWGNITPLLFSLSLVHHRLSSPQKPVLLAFPSLAGSYPAFKIWDMGMNYRQTGTQH